MMQRLSRALREERGSVLLFTFTALVFLLVMGGFAIDFAYQVTAKNEVQRSMDAAALAGAGKLGFNDTVFPTARQFARQYATANPYRIGTITLDLNTPNLSTGNIVLGIWEGTTHTFTPDLTGTLVNAVKAQYSTAIPTSFLRLLGVNSLTVSAQAIAWAPPPATPPTTNTAKCVAPLALTDAPFIGGGASGCGKPVRMISSSEESAIGANTAGWANLTGCGTPSSNTTRDAIAAAGGPCPVTTLKVGDYIGTNGGMADSAFADMADLFKTKYNESKASGEKLIVQETQDEIVRTSYEGFGWPLFVPVVRASESTTSCPSAPITLGFPFNIPALACVGRVPLMSLFVGTAFAAPSGGGTNVTQNRQIVGWTEFIMTQVIDGGKCVVENLDDEGNKPFWPPQGGNPNPCGSRASLPGDPALREIYGYYSCQLLQSPGQTPPEVGPTTARAKLKLVQ